jgi:hypothetical protein
VFTLRILDFEHTLGCLSLDPFKVLPRLVEVLLGQTPTRCSHQQERFDRRPGATGCFCNDLHRAGILIEDRPFRHLYGAAG